MQHVISLPRPLITDAVNGAGQVAVAAAAVGPEVTSSAVPGRRCRCRDVGGGRQSAASRDVVDSEVAPSSFHRTSSSFVSGLSVSCLLLPSSVT